MSRINKELVFELKVALLHKKTEENPKRTTDSCWHFEKFQKKISHGLDLRHPKDNVVR